MALLFLIIFSSSVTTAIFVYSHRRRGQWRETLLRISLVMIPVLGPLSYILVVHLPPPPHHNSTRAHLTHASASLSASAIESIAPKPYHRGTEETDFQHFEHMPFAGRALTKFLRWIVLALSVGAAFWGNIYLYLSFF